MSEVLKEHVQDGNWTLVLNRPDKRNALNAELVEALIDALERAGNSGADSLVLRGEGSNFCAGFDFSDFDQASEGDLLWRFVRIEQLLDALYSSPLATFAYAHGKNFGAGVDLLVSCQRRVASSQSAFRMPGLKFGLVLGTRRLASRIGADQARAIQEVAATLSAEQAHKAGLITQICEAGELDDLIKSFRADAVALDQVARASLYRVLADHQPDRDLAGLVRSVMRPGLKQRIASYRKGG